MIYNPHFYLLSSQDKVLFFYDFLKERGAFEWYAKQLRLFLARTGSLDLSPEEFLYKVEPCFWLSFLNLSFGDERRREALVKTWHKTIMDRDYYYALLKEFLKLNASWHKFRYELRKERIRLTEVKYSHPFFVLDILSEVDPKLKLAWFRLLLREGFGTQPVQVEKA